MVDEKLIIAEVDVTFTWDDASETRIITSHIRYMELISPRIL